MMPWLLDVLAGPRCASPALRGLVDSCLGNPAPGDIIVDAGGGSGENDGFGHSWATRAS